ncbi:Microsomal glutathione S-transferase 3 [Coemansia erecta]|uniref:Microsomal glutathione S-transferase 3 n=1 Tax=Coemansia erecta TaxID=147472 RepID=A0A9W7Y3I3_9FUNG|nr:Microsomal glutathione S-transferase 3 [Coemansia erecta]
MTIIIGANFGYCVLAAVGISVQCVLAGHDVGVARKKYKVDYPDNGGGRFADKLSDEDWLAFNNIKRTSDNYSEQVGVVLTLLVLAGLYMPRAAGGLGAAYILGRSVYARGYKAKGPKGRMAGGALMALSLVSMVGVATYSAVVTTLLA